MISDVPCTPRTMTSALVAARRRRSTRRSGTFLATLAVVAVLALATVGCGGDNNNNSSSASTASPKSTSPKTTSGQAATVRVANTGLGKVLVDANGRTLYLFQRDSGTTSSCNGACAAAWPPLTVNGTPTAGSGASASKLETTTRSDGSRQVVYNGHPLYRYVGDQKAGDTNGQGLTAFGGGWFALSPAGAQISAQGSNPGGGFGY